MVRRRELLGSLGVASVSLVAGCQALGSDSGHANLVNIAVANQRSEPSPIGLRLWNAETDELIRDYRIELEGAVETDETGQRLNCDWPYQEPLIANAALLGDEGEVIDTHEIATRDIDAECLHIKFYAGRNDRMLSTSARDSCDQAVMENYVESCDST